jgi:hypothetical protein
LDKEGDNDASFFPIPHNVGGGVNGHASAKCPRGEMPLFLRPTKFGNGIDCSRSAPTLAGMPLPPRPARLARPWEERDKKT